MHKKPRLVQIQPSNNQKALQLSTADAVMSATGAMWNPFLAKDIKQLESKKQ